ncbi:MAG TPA: phosphate ABC transporter substrate-binding protein [Clostridiales bacterium]|nr:phosphate ABC transporter substrate-binding protein [Clostridiales bacterium]
MKRIIGINLAVVLILTTLLGCGRKENTGITVISREEGSGTRSAFAELMGILSDGTDNTTQTAEITNSTSVMIATVEGNVNAIGYISLGSMNDSVKAVKVDGVEATAENIKNGSYPAARPFIVASKDNLSRETRDFVDFILSTEGQKIIEEAGYISAAESGGYNGGGMRGRITLAGSTSVAPVMEVLAEAYRELNPDVEIEIQQTGSSAGMISAIEGVCDLGMASRRLKDSETEAGLTPIVIAMDGIAVIVNRKNSVDSLTGQQIKKIFTGEITDWSEIG